MGDRSHDCNGLYAGSDERAAVAAGYCYADRPILRNDVAVPATIVGDQQRAESRPLELESRKQTPLGKKVSLATKNLKKSAQRYAYV